MKSSAKQMMVHEIRDLRERITALEARRDILDNFHRYGSALDYGDEEAWVACFTDDGLFEVTGHPKHSTYRGRQALAGFAAQHTRAPDHIHKHCVFDVQVDITGEEALSMSYFARLDQMADGPVVHAFGRYHDVIVRGADGRWRFKHRRVEIEAIR
jgi:ketosteroid isomerase-like protein